MDKPTEFHKYPKLFHMEKALEEGFEFENIEVKEKLDGCFTYNTRIKTDQGAIMIGLIVNKKLPVKVLSYNHTTGELEYKQIINYYKNGTGNNWKKLIYEINGKTQELIVTNNHKFYDGSKYKMLSEFSINDLIFLRKQKLTEPQIDLLIGSILGDGSFRHMNSLTCRSPLYSETHSMKQQDYLLFKKEILKNIISKYEENEGDFYGFPTKKCRIYSYSIRDFKQLEFLYENGKKKITNEIIKRLNYKSLAIWFCDDGSTGFSEKQRPRAKLHTEGLSDKECQILVKALSKFEYSTKIQNYGKGNVIQFDTNSSEKLYKDIVKYVPYSMRYKLPKEYKNNILKWEYKHININQTKIVDIQDYESKTKQKYDIGVADNHNYFIKDVLVSNSNMRLTIHNNKLVFGSRNKIPPHYEMFKDVIEYVEQTVKKDHMRPNYIYYMEAMIPHRIHYDKNPPLVLGFDVLNNNTGKFIPNWKDEFVRIGLTPVKSYGIMTVTEYEEKYFKVLHSDPESFKSQWGNVQVEGFVAADYENQIYMKTTTEMFRESPSVMFPSQKTTKDLLIRFVEDHLTEARILKIAKKIELDTGKPAPYNMVALKAFEDAVTEEFRPFMKCLSSRGGKAIARGIRLVKDVMENEKS